MKKYKILVFPCGSEIGLEVYRSLRYSTHFDIIGANSVDDHGKFIYENYIGGVPFISENASIPHLANIVATHDIDAIYPTMDEVIWKLKNNEDELGCTIIASESATTEICLSKRKTYAALKAEIDVPVTFNSVCDVDSYPVFVKPDIGYGSRGAFKANSEEELVTHFRSHSESDFIISEFLPGEEYTVDCFTDRYGDLRFFGPRLRNRVSNGISVHTFPIEKELSKFENIALQINKNLKLNGAWFFQVKASQKGKLTLLEIASRLGGSSCLFRGRGINFALLSSFNAFNLDVDILVNHYAIEQDRALDVKYKLKIKYSTVYVDYDDCLLLNNSNVNTQLLSFLFRCINGGKKIVLLTRHAGNLNDSLAKFRLAMIFDEVIHIQKGEAKSDYIADESSIFIDDSHSERLDVKRIKGIHVFSPDMLDML